MSARSSSGCWAGIQRALVVAPRSDLADQRQVLRIGVQRLADELVGDVGAVELRGVDVVDAQLDGSLEYCDRLVVIAWRAEHAGSRQLHGAEPDAVDRVLAKQKGSHRFRLATSRLRRGSVAERRNRAEVVTVVQAQ